VFTRSAVTKNTSKCFEAVLSHLKAKARIWP